MKFRKMIKNHWDKVWQDGEKIYQVHRIHKEAEFAWGTREPYDVFNCKIHGCKCIHPHNCRNHLCATIVRILREWKLYININKNIVCLYENVDGIKISLIKITWISGLGVVLFLLSVVDHGVTVLLSSINVLHQMVIGCGDDVI